MSLVLTSNREAVSYISDSYGIASDKQWDFLADFSTLTFKNGNGDNVSQGSVLTTLRAQKVNIFNTKGEVDYIKENTPRLSYNPVNKEHGLLVEPKGLFYEFNNPVTGTVTIGKTLPTDLMRVEVSGSGKADLTFSGIQSKHGMGTQDSPLYIKSSGQGSISATLTITGSVSKVVVTTQTAPLYSNTTSSILGVTGGRVYDDVTSLKVAPYVTGLDYTYLVTLMPNGYFKDYFINDNYVGMPAVVQVPLLSIASSGRWTPTIATDSYALEFIAKSYNSGMTDELSVIYVKEGTAITTVNLTKFDLNKPMVLAVSCSPSGYRISVNGQCTDLINKIPAKLMQEVYFGLTNRGGNQVRPTGTFGKVAVFNQSMSRVELERLTSKSY